jgi:hypothetical protein
MFQTLDNGCEIWVGGWFWAEVLGRALSPNCERRWLILLGDIIKVVFMLKIRWTSNVGT